MLIGFCQIIGFYSEKVIAEQVVGFIQKYDIKKKLGYFIFNNAISNDTCVEAILKVIWPDFSKKKQRLWCIEYIINLAAQVFLYNKNKKAFIVKMQNTWSLTDIKNQYKVWRKKGPIRKLYNIITFICRIPQRCKQFWSMDISQVDLNIKTMKNLIVICNNDIYWNFTCNIIKRALHFCHQIDAFYTVNQYFSKQIWKENDNDKSVCHDMLTFGDWETLKKLYNLTKPF